MTRRFFDTILVDGSNAAFDMTYENLSRNVKQGGGNEDPSKKNLTKCCESDCA